MSSVAGQPTPTDPPSPPSARAGEDTGLRASEDERPRPERRDATPEHHDELSRREREKERFGGIKIACAFFGWLAATGMSVVLLAILAGIGAAVANARGTTAAEVTADPASAGIVGAIVALVVLAIAYFCGGYVAGRMARFNGAKQGIAVWLWAVLVAIILALIAAIAGTQTGLLSQISVPSIPISSSNAALGSIISAVIVAVVALVFAVLGGLAGMRFHRKVDRAGLGG